jgi:hypothetical protein
MAWTYRWLTIDPRALGAYRIALGLLATMDFVRSAAWATELYTAGGWVPPLDPTIGRTFSLLAWLDTPPLVYGFFAVAIASAIAFTLGWRTRVVHALTWVCAISVHSNRFPGANAGSLILHLFLMWTLFLPMGRAFSLDARRSRVAGIKTDPTTPVWSLAVAALWLQISAIYGFNALEKWGTNWLDGTALHYFFQLDTFATPLTLAVRDELPLWGVRGMTHAAQAMEAAIALFVLSPWSTTLCRRLCAVFIVCLHAGITIFGELGLFPYTCMAFSLLLWPKVIPTAPRAWSAKGLLSTGCIAILLFINTAQGLASNETTRTLLKGLDLPRQTPTTFRPIVYGAQLTQRWNLFAPNVPAGEGRLVLDAITVDGEHLDPLTGIAPDFGPNHADKTNFNQFWRKYCTAVESDSSGAFAAAIGRWHLTHFEAPALQSVDVWWVYDRSPEPGQAGGAQVSAIQRLASLP